MATTYTTNLRLAINSNLTAEAKANLAKIDNLGATFTQDTAGNTLLRSIEDIYMMPNDPSVGGTGTGGKLFVGSSSHELESIQLFTGELLVTSPLGTLDQATGGTKYLHIRYNSTLAGSVDTASDRYLSIDLEGADRSLVLGTSFTVSSTSLGMGTNTYTFPSSSATLVDLDDSQTLSNKSLSGAANTFSNIGYSSLVLTSSIINTDVSPSAAIAYSKLNLSNSIINGDIASGAAISYSKLNLSNSVVDADVATGAAIAGTKVTPDFGSQNVRTEGEVQIAKNATVASRFSASASQASDIDYTLPPSAPTAGQVLVSDGSANLSWASVGSGTVTSVAAALSAEADAILAWSGSPVTTSGTLTLDLDTQNSNKVLAGPASGADAKPTFRTLVADDIPSLTASKISDYNSAWDTRLATKSTTDLTEGSNLYYTTARANTDFDNRLATKSTTDLAEGTNLYHTNSRVDDRITLQKGAVNGLATLDAGGKIPTSQLPNSVMEYKGNWNATTNSPTLADGVGNAGDVYRVNVAGTIDLGSGSISFAVGDWVVYNGSIWEKSLNSNAVTSVNGLTGIVVLTTTELTEGTNLYYTDSRVDTRLATYKYATTWAPGDGTSKAITHSLGTTDVTWSIFNIDSGEEVWPDTATRTSANAMTFTSSVAPSGSGWRVVVRS